MMIREVVFSFLRLFPSSSRLKLYHFLCRLGRLLYGETDVSVQRLPGNIYMKQGKNIEQEIEAMRLVKPRISLPVPTILDVVDDAFIMTALPGEPLGNFFKYMDDAEVESIQKDLRKLIQELHNIPSQAEGVVSGPLPSMCCCDINRVHTVNFGPFENAAGFHEHLLSCYTSTYSQPFCKEAREVYDKPYKTVFTHGDMHLRNILYDPSKRQLSGIVDWTNAGWYPEYWEHGKAVYPQRMFPKWRNLWANVLPGYEKELELERKMWDNLF